MGKFDGLSSRGTGDISYSHIVKLANGLEYYLTDYGFEIL